MVRVATALLVLVGEKGEGAKLSGMVWLAMACDPQRCSYVVVRARDCDALGYVRGVLEVEINSVTDNPIIFPDDGVAISGGNFHGRRAGL